MEGDQLAVEQASEDLVGLPAGREERLLGPEKADFDAVARDSGQLREVVGMDVGVRDHEVGGPHRSSVDRPEHARLRRAVRPAAAIVDDRVVEGQHRVEDDGFRACGPPGTSQVEMSGVPDDHYVEVRLGLLEKASLRSEQRHRSPRTEPELVLALPYGLVSLDHRYSRPAQARDHLCVPRVVPFVRSEVEDLHRDVSEGSRRRAARGDPPVRGIARGAGSSRARRGARERGTESRRRRAGHPAAAAASGRSPRPRFSRS